MISIVRVVSITLVGSIPLLELELPRELLNPLDSWGVARNSVRGVGSESPCSRRVVSLRLKKMREARMLCMTIWGLRDTALQQDKVRCFLRRKTHELSISENWIYVSWIKRDSINWAQRAYRRGQCNNSIYYGENFQIIRTKEEEARAVEITLT